MRQARDVQTDLEACVTALRDCLSGVEQSAQHSLQAAQILKSWQLPTPQQSIDTPELTNKVANLIALTDSLEHNQSALAADENLLLLKGHSLELQLMAAKLDESMLRFELSDHPADER